MSAPKLLASDKILYELEPDLEIYPASMTKIMTSIIAFDLLKQGKIKLEDEVIKVNPEVLKSKKLNEFEEIIFGRITDPKHTYLSSISKMASLNHTLEFIRTAGQILVFILQIIILYRLS